ncbi:VOC family protein [Domibacillus sp. A3M-37]|uniref:VOC family protein n=1 Tax=Domibacillus sp. A3M-37 TaxID=2962037 RepID=UPI0020B793C4|nr:VOC family protein [Domibacillus sp. A3M-37]MCP3762931.1 VOC family protein [Domibacillus sp. A3M-37]
MAIQPYLVFDGNCGDVLDFYEKVFQTGPANRTRFGDSPPNPDYPLPEEAKDLMMHANLEVEGTTLMFSDTFPGMPYQPGSAITLALISSDAEKLRAYFEGLSENGEVIMPLQETFWSKVYGQVRDQFGIQWQISHEGQQ